MERAINPIGRASYRVLAIDPEPAVRQVLAAIFSPICRMALASNGSEAQQQFERQPADLILVDGNLENHDHDDEEEPLDYREMIQLVRREEPRLPVIVLTADDSSRRDRQAVSFLSKQLLGSETGRLKLILHVDRLVRAWHNQRQQSFQTQRRRRAAQEGANFVIGPSDAGARLRDEIERASSCDLNVLLTGETGVGKTLVAESIHQAWCADDERPFVVVEPAALPPSLFESELFGHARGAFTGAHAVQHGAFEAAHRGTILLDEIGELPFELQVKLLRAVEGKVVRRIGAAREVRLEVRIIAASNRDIERDVDLGRFRADLYQRLNEIQVHIPPLRERQDDILLLFEHFLGLYAPSRRVPCQIEPAVTDYLRSYHWPGNVRELRTLARRLAQPGLPDRLTLETIGPFFPARRGRVADESPDLDARIKDYSRRVYLQAISSHQYRLRDAARAMGMPYGTLRSRLKSLGLLDVIGEMRQNPNSRRD